MSVCARACVYVTMCVCVCVCVCIHPCKCVGVELTGQRPPEAPETHWLGFIPLPFNLEPRFQVLMRKDPLHLHPRRPQFVMKAKSQMEGWPRPCPRSNLQSPRDTPSRNLWQGAVAIMGAGVARSKKKLRHGLDVRHQSSYITGGPTNLVCSASPPMHHHPPAP